MLVAIATHVGFFVLYLFLLSSLLGSLFLWRTSYKRRDFVPDSTADRYALLRREFPSLDVSKLETNGRAEQVRLEVFEPGVRTEPNDATALRLELVAKACSISVSGMVEQLLTGSLSSLIGSMEFPTEEQKDSLPNQLRKQNLGERYDGLPADVAQAYNLSGQGATPVFSICTPSRAV